jgi:hypothetical protein
MKTDFRYITSFFVLVVLVACNSWDEPDGGSCIYDKKKYPATVIGIEKKDSLNAEVYFRVNDSLGNVYRDSVTWSREKKEWMSLAKIEKDSIAVGKKYTYEVWKIITGHCNPDIEILKLEECE